MTESGKKGMRLYADILMTGTTVPTTKKTIIMTIIDSGRPIIIHRGHPCTKLRESMTRQNSVPTPHMNLDTKW